MTTLNLSATRRRDKVVIMKAFNLESKYLTRRSFSWADVTGAAKRAASALFSGKAIALAMGLGISAMWWHNFTIDDPDAAGVAVATDCLCALPWAIVWVCRETFSEKGGKK